jgi:transposase
MRKARKHYTAQEKVAILRKHLLEKVPVSTICEEHQLQPTAFYRWQQDFFENGAAALERRGQPANGADHKRIGYLESKLARKDEVLAELMEEHVALKKRLGVL